MTTTKQTNIETEAASQETETLTPSENDDNESQSGAYNPETGEINWDCPCLNGMAKGTCGEQFKAAFSCFIYSKAETKGSDCLNQFQKMNDCFRQHPDEYGEELDDDDDDDLEEETKQIDMAKEEANPITEESKQIDKKSTITVSSTTESSKSNTNEKQKSET